MVKRKNAHVPAMVDVITSDDWVAMVFHPYTSQSVVWDLVVFVYSLNDKQRWIGLISFFLNFHVYFTPQVIFDSFFYYNFNLTCKKAGFHKLPLEFFPVWKLRRMMLLFS